MLKKLKLYLATPVEVFWDNARSRVFRESGRFQASSFVRAWVWGQLWTALHPWGAVSIQKPGTALTATPEGWRAPPA